MPVRASNAERAENPIKTQFSIVLGGLVESAGLGMFATDGMLLRNSQADLATLPGGAVASCETLHAGQVRRLDVASPGLFQLDGSPDMVLEVISAGSAHKATVELKESYWQAGVREYWLVDARSEPVRFDILKRKAKGYTTTSPQAGGWLKSAVFGRSFRLTQQLDPLGDPKYTLAVRR
jgi:hypothetical protein